MRSASENVDTIRNRIAKESITNVQVEHNAEIPPENMLSELKSLRNKYDGVVAYTVRLTAERDVMVQKLEGTEKEIANLRKKSNNSDGSSVGEFSKADRTMEKQTNMKVRNSSFDSHIYVKNNLSLLLDNLESYVRVVYSLNYSLNLLHF